MDELYSRAPQMAGLPHLKELNRLMRETFLNKPWFKLYAWPRRGWHSKKKRVRKKVRSEHYRPKLQPWLRDVAKIMQPNAEVLHDTYLDMMIFGESRLKVTIDGIHPLA